MIKHICIELVWITATVIVTIFMVSFIAMLIVLLTHIIGDIYI